MSLPVSQTDLELMRRAMDLAIRGRGAVEPNPMVGCVIVKEGRVIGEGYHERFGGPHAEPNALAACTESPAGATAYVSLEPCCHTNKKTPPCAPRLIEAKVSRVVVGTLDPNPQVAGRGVEQLRAAGIRVDVLDLPQARQLIAPFIALTVHRRPYVTLKWAESADGKIAGPPGVRLWISNRQSLHIVHELRARCDAILVGMNTVTADDPLLTVRGVTPMRPLRRVVLNRDLTISPSSRLVQSADQGPVEIICSEAARERNADVVGALETRAVEVTGMPLGDDGRIELAQVLHHLGNRGVTHLLVEPGPTLTRTFLRKNLADRVWIFRSPTQVGDPTAPNGVRVTFPPTGTTTHNGDVLTEYLNPASPVFFALDESPDLRQFARSGESAP
jgi:diaminohydroxyphosphoribosylaminopyrimidine deaminase / 5-amino-6-(5-phosphoribosylamino)uracil reductase